MNVHYTDTGTGEPVLLLHGYPQTAACWRHQIPGLAADHRVVAPDLPGFGRSDPPDSPATYDAEVARIDQFADSAGLDRFNLIAHDYGGFLGLGYTLRHPERVKRLALLNTRAHGVFRRWFYEVSRGQRMLVTHAPGLTRRLPLRAIHEKFLAPYRRMGCFDDALADEYLGWLDTPRGRQTFIDFFRHYHLPVLPWLGDGLGQIDCPTAIIWGDRDRYLPVSTAQQLAQRIPHATLTQLSGGDHYIMEQRPDEVTQALRELLARSPVTEARRA